MKNRYFVLRHGYTDKNAYDLVASFPEIKKFHLTDDGIAQVQESAQWLSDKNINRIISSDIERAKESAAIVSERLGVPVICDERLREIDFGTYNGKTHAEFETFFADTNSLAERFVKVPPEGESWNDVTRRIAAFFLDCEERYADESILIVSHGDPIWLMLWLVSGKPFSQIHTIEYPQTGKAYPLVFNSYIELKDTYV